MGNILFGSWDSIARTVVVGSLAYVTLVIFLRISGRRTLSKMNAFDFVVTVALGSTLATILLNKDIPLIDGSVAFVLLIGLQFVVTWLSVRVPWVRQVVTGEPLMLLHKGELLLGAMKKSRVTADEVRSAVRAHGAASLSDVEAIVLETDGSFSVVRRQDSGSRSSLENVVGP